MQYSDAMDHEDMTQQEFDAAFAAGVPVDVVGQGRVIIVDSLNFPGATHTALGVISAPWAAGRPSDVASFVAPGASQHPMANSVLTA